MDAVRPDALVRDELARLCLLALAADCGLVAEVEAGSLERLAEVVNSSA